MADVTDDGFTEEAFKGLEVEQGPTKGDDTPPTPVEENAPPAGDDPVKETPEKDDATPPEQEPKPNDAPPEKQVEDETPPEQPQAITKDDVTDILSKMRNEERESIKELDTTTKEVLESYYPEGLSNVLVDEQSGKELRTPQDVVDVSGGSMSIEEAAQWLLNEQHKLNNSVAEIQDSARKIAETTVNFKHDGLAVLQKYQPLFEGLKEKYPHLQDKVFNTLMKQVKVDADKGVILAAPDVVEFYDDYLAPYKEAFETATNQSATATPPAPAPPKPTLEDRMDEHGDGGASPIDDPNDFAQQVNKELMKGI
jgi:hypothetical protein